MHVGVIINRIHNLRFHGCFTGALMTSRFPSVSFSACSRNQKINHRDKWHRFFGRPLQVMLCLCCGTVVHCLSVSLSLCLSVHCGQMVGWLKMPLHTEVGHGPGDIVLGGDPAPPRKGAQQPPLFGRCLLCPNDRPSRRLLSSFCRLDVVPVTR